MARHPLEAPLQFSQGIRMKLNTKNILVGMAIDFAGCIALAIASKGSMLVIGIGAVYAILSFVDGQRRGETVWREPYQNLATAVLEVCDAAEKRKVDEQASKESGD